MVVEGEPGIFPDPFARMLRRIGRWHEWANGGRSEAPAPADEGTPEPPARPDPD